MFFRRRSAEPPAMTLEGVLGPNTRLDEAEGRVVPGASTLVVVADGLLVAAHSAVLRMSGWDAEPVVWLEAPQPVVALAAGPGGLVAVLSLGGGLMVVDPQGRRVGGWPEETGVQAATDAVFLSQAELAVADSGYGPGEDILTLAPWDDEARGRVVSVGPSGTRVLAGGLHCPTGLASHGEGLAIVEMERGRIVDASGRVLRPGLPAYAGRLRRAGGGYLLACLARRDPLIEFLKTETEFVAEMKARIAPKHWIGPRASPEFSHDLPIAMGATRLFGEVKPWAPSFSYGLVIELDGDLMPTGSAHSRANGTRHAIADVAEWDGRVVALSAASGEVLRL